jgi:hypothetical protein
LLSAIFQARHGRIGGYGALRTQTDPTARGARMRGPEVRPDSVLSERRKIAYKTINAGAKPVATAVSFREAWRARR